MFAVASLTRLDDDADRANYPSSSRPTRRRWRCSKRARSLPCVSLLPPVDDRPAGDRSVPDREQLERAIAAQESLRGVVPDDVVDAAVATLRLQLDSAQVESQRRRQVTVLFADVSGFTSMSSGLDPETVAGVINDAWARLDSVIVGHGGHIDKHIGDGVMAIWGMPSTREDDPERAVRAALAMQHELEAANSNGLRMRVGINTGPVHVGAVGAAVSTEFTAIGDAVNVASRVEGVAPLGGVLVTHDTYRHIRGVFDVDELPPAVVKGRVEPVRVYLVRRAKDRAFRMPTRGVEGVETRMIGRARELSLLQAEFDRVLRAPGMRLVIFTGEAGVGKSRLLYEFEHWIDLHPASAYFFKGRALATRQSIPFGLARDLFGDRFDVLDSDSAAVVAEKLGAGFGPTLTAGEAEVVGHWLGFDLRASAAVQALLGAGKLPPTARAHLVHYLNTLASDSPVVVFLEDLHWADDESLALVDELIVELESARILAVGVARPTVRERLAAEPLFDRAETVFDLGALDADSTRTLVTEVLQRAPAVPDELADLVVARADGNAFYVEELVKMLIEDGVIETGEPWDPWAIHVDRLDPDRVPATLTGVLQTRLDILAPPERAALQRSSVVGRVFWDGTVASLGSDSIEATTRSLELTRAARARVPARSVFLRRHRRVQIQTRAAPRRRLRDRPSPRPARAPRSRSAMDHRARRRTPRGVRRADRDALSVGRRSGRGRRPAAQGRRRCARGRQRVRRPPKPRRGFRALAPGRSGPTRRRDGGDGRSVPATRRHRGRAPSCRGGAQSARRPPRIGSSPASSRVGRRASEATTPVSASCSTTSCPKQSKWAACCSSACCAASRGAWSAKAKQEPRWRMPNARRSSPTRAGSQPA